MSFMAEEARPFYVIENAQFLEDHGRGGMQGFAGQSFRKPQRVYEERGDTVFGALDGG